MGEHNKAIWVDCLHCKKKFKTFVSYIKLGGGKYCSRKCCTLASRRTIITYCEVCGKKIISNPSRIIKGESKYCSSKCQAKKLRTGRVVNCKKCGKFFYQQYSLGKIGKARFCSPECFNTHVDVKCTNCNKTISIRKLIKERRTEYFCNRKCFSEYRASLRDPIIDKAKSREACHLYYMTGKGIKSIGLKKFFAIRYLIVNRKLTPELLNKIKEGATHEAYIRPI